MQEFLEKIKKFSKVVIFGYSDKGKIIEQLIRKQFPSIYITYCDNDKEKQQNGEKVLSVNEAVLHHRDAAYIIPSHFFENEKKAQLYSLGIIKDQVIEDIPEKVYIMEGKQKRLCPLTEETFHFEFCIAKHCNLNCRSCDHFSPLVEKEMMDFAQFQKDIKRMSDLFHRKSEQILILGGEPLLNPDIKAYMKETRNHFPHANIYIVTNGILLGKMKKDFWCSSSNYRIGIRVTRYPIEIRYEEMKRLAEDNQIDFGYFGSTKLGERNMWHQPFDLSGRQDMDENFLLCYSGNHCVTLDSGRLYTCPIPLTSRAFNRYFKTNLELSDRDYIDIYQAESSKQILEKLANPIPFCRYCDVKHRTYDHPWEGSKRDIKEWML